MCKIEITQENAFNQHVSVFYLTETDDGHTHNNALPEATMWSAKTLSISFDF